MSKKFLVRKSAAILGLIGALSMSLFNSCTKDNPTALDQDKPAYDFSGFVIDGYTGKALGGAVVSYYNEDNDSVTFTTVADGGFKIEKIPYGDKSFFFSYKPAGATAVQYTTAAITIEGNDWENFAAKGIGAGAVDTAFGAIRNVAGPVKLYPLSGSLTGNVSSQIHARGELIPVGNTVVKVTFDPAANLDKQGNDDAVIGSNVEIGPRTFEALTDATGRFTITGLPVSGDQNEKVKIKVVSVTSNGIDWAMTGDGIQVELVSGQSVPVGQIIMNPIVKIALIDLDNNFKTGVVSPEHTFEITYSDSLDSAVTYAVLSYEDNMDVKRNVPVTIAVSGKKVSINPTYSLINEQNYSLDVFAYGRKGQSVTKTFVVTAAGGGLSDIVTSNILTDTKAPVYNFNVKTPITITFADSIVGNPSVQVTNNDVTASKSGKILTITPKSIWKNGTVGVNVVLNNGTTVRFSTPLYVENALAFVTSNIYDFTSNSAKNGLGLTDPIVFTTNKAINNAAVKVILTQGGVSLPTTYTVAEGDQQIDIRPVNTLKAATSYSLTITVENVSGESKSQVVTFTTTAAKFYPLADNVRIGNDANMPRLDFAPNANIVIKMNRKVVKATASLTNPSPVNTKVSIQNDSIIIDPEDILAEGTPYSLSVTAEDSLGNTISGAYVTGLVPRALVMILASNIITADNESVKNADRAITPWFKLSTAPVEASIKVIITNPSVDADVVVRGDTLFVNPVADFKYGANPTIAVTGVAADNNYISFTKLFTVEKRPAISLVASNVLNDNYEGLTNVAENIEMWYFLSRTPIAAKVAATVDGDNAVVRVSGDTVFVKPVKNFASNATPVVRITGLDDEGLAFDLLGSNAAVGLKTPDWPAFTVRPALFPVASNTWDANGDPVKNFAFYDTMWVKFSQALSTDLSLIAWQNDADIDDIPGTPAVDEFVSADAKQNPNATAWVKGDTLFVLPDNRVDITWNEKVGFGVNVKTPLGQVSALSSFQVEMAPLNLFVKATNTLRTDGTERNDVNFSETLFVVSSVRIDSIDNVTVGAVAGHVAPPDIAAGLIKTAVRLSASKDTIFYAPKVQFVPGAQYTIDFNVFLADDKNNLRSNVLGIGWEVKQGVAIYSANVFTNATTYRAFKITGDSLVVTFTKAINYASTANPFVVNGAPWASATTSWSSDAKTVTIKPTNEIAATAWTNDQNYYNVDEHNGSLITFTGVTTDGEVFAALDGKNKFIPEIRVVADMGLALLSTNLLDSANNVTFALPIAADQDARDGSGTDSLLPITSNITLTFSRVVDTAKVKLNANAYIKLWEKVNGATNDIQNEIVLAYSNSGKTITIDPVVNLKYGTTYYVEIDNVPALITGATGVVYNALAAADANFDNNHIFNNGFKTVASAKANISALVVSDLGVDTVPTATGDKRYGYSPDDGAGSNIGDYSGGQFRGPDALTLRFTELAWNSNHDDSIGAYQVQVRAVGSKSTGWYTYNGTLAAQGFSAFNSTLKNRNGLTINLTTQSFYNDLKTNSRVPTTDYLNGNQVFNYGDSIAVRIRPIRDGGDETGEFGQWSNIAYFKDNVAPADSVMCTDFASKAQGGVSVAVATSDGLGLNRTGQAALTYTITLTFPEDMDTSTDAVLYTWWGTTLDAGEAAITKTGYFTKANVYVLTATFAANTNYANNVPYFSIGVAGMRDASAVTIASHGNNGGAADNVAIGVATTNDVQGSNNIQGLTSF